MTTAVIADDHHVMRNVLRQVLEANTDVEVVGMARDGEEALALVSQYHPDLLITDISMPGKSGLELARELSTQNVQTRILLISIYESADVARSALQNGANGFLTKRHVIAVIAEAIKRVMAGETYIYPLLEGRLGGTSVS